MTATTNPMKVKCRTCGRPLTVRCDKDYVGDPMGMAKLVVCTTCFDRHTRKRKIEDWISKTCHQLVHLDEVQKREFREQMVTATRKYAEVLCSIHGRKDSPSIGELAQQLYDDPMRWPVLLRKFRMGFETR